MILTEQEARDRADLIRAAESMINRAQAAIGENLAEAMFEAGPDDRVAELRRSILGNDATPEPHLVGLSAWLPTEPPKSA